mmetsp:Transcript_11343/g.31653  ORF Transcript_11343/g.31653 Transcript_11343/m.31653 type:complete len:105 (-) Transcript_11343:8-322(-)
MKLKYPRNTLNAEDGSILALLAPDAFKDAARSLNEFSDSSVRTPVVSTGSNPGPETYPKSALICASEPSIAHHSQTQLQWPNSKCVLDVLRVFLGLFDYWCSNT